MMIASFRLMLGVTAREGDIPCCFQLFRAIGQRRSGYWSHPSKQLSRPEIRGAVKVAGGRMSLELAGNSHRIFRIDSENAPSYAKERIQ